MTARNALRLLATSATTGLVLLSASPVWATSFDDGGASGPGLSVQQTVLLFVVAPVALFAVISLLAVAPSLLGGPRYRPGLGWWAAPVWFNGPGGAGGDEAAEAVQAASPTTEGGGTSARW